MKKRVLKNLTVDDIYESRELVNGTIFGAMWVSGTVGFVIGVLVSVFVLAV